MSLTVSLLDSLQARKSPVLPQARALVAEGPKRLRDARGNIATRIWRVRFPCAAMRRDAQALQPWPIVFRRMTIQQLELALLYSIRPANLRTMLWRFYARRSDFFVLGFCDLHDVYPLPGRPHAGHLPLPVLGHTPTLEDVSQKKQKAQTWGDDSGSET